jgi:ABC-type transport system involved in cytochrome c biogenesis permease component
MYREGKIRATNLAFIFWDLFYPLAYLLVFGVGMTQAMGMTPPGIGVDYNAFFLAGVLGMASFGIASNTAWSFFMDRDNGIFYEMLTYPMRRAEYLLGKGLFNLAVSILQAIITVVLAELVLNVPIRWQTLPLFTAAVFVGTAGWFFFYAIFALMIRGNDVFNTVTSIFYFVLLFATAGTIAADCVGQPDHLARRRPEICHHRRRRSVAHLARVAGLSRLHHGLVRGGALGAAAAMRLEGKLTR